MNLSSTQIKDTYGNLVTIGSVAGTPTTGTLQNGAGSDLTSITLNGGAVFNEGGGDFDFRVEGQGEPNLLFVDASTARVGIGTASPSTNTKLQVDGPIAMRGDADVRLTLGSAGTINANTSNYIRAATDVLIYNTASGRHSWEIGGSEKMRIDSSGNVGIGTSSPSSRLHITNTGGTYDKGIWLQTFNSGNIATIWTSQYDLNIGIGGAHKFVNFDGTAEYARIDSDGLKFNGDTAAANALDDYEEGLWDATLASGATTTPTVVNAGRYTKIGRVVHITMTAQFTSITLNGTAVVITGLPFLSGVSNAVGNIGFSARLQYQASASHCWRIENSNELHAVYMPANAGTASDLLSEASGTYSPTLTANITYTI